MPEIATISDWVQVTTNEALSPQARSRAAADFARGEIMQANEANRRVLGRVPPHKSYVDGRAGAPLESVNPEYGMIVVEWELIGDVLVAIGQMLKANSPFVSGRYRDAHTLFADGQEVPISANVPHATEYVFLNPLPYSRRLELGKTKSGRPFSVQVPPRIYERTRNQANARFGNICKIVYGFRAPMNGTFHTISRVGPLQVKRDGKGRYTKGSHVRAGNQEERAMRVPAIIIYTD